MATGAQKEYTETLINWQLERIGADRGETGIFASESDLLGCVRIADGVCSGDYPADAVLEALRRLPADATWQDAWDAICDTTDDPEGL